MSENRDTFETEMLPKLEAAHTGWLENARLYAALLGMNGLEVTIDDVRDGCPPPENIDPRVMGAVFTRKHWVLIRRTRSKRRACHNRPIGVFVLRSTRP